MDPNLYSKRRGGLSLAELLVEDSDIEGGDIYVTPPRDGEDTDIDSDQSDDDHDGDISHLGPAMLRVESEFIPASPCNRKIPNAEEYDSDENIPLATLFPNAALNWLSNDITPSSSKRRKIETWTNQEISFNIEKDCTEKNPPEEVYSKTTPLEFFHLFFDEEVLSNIEEQTNIYAQQKNLDLRMTRSELLVVFGGLLLSGYGKYPNKRMYWSNENDVPKILSESMRLNRFELILRHVHLNDNSQINNENKLYKLQPLIDKLNQNFKYYGGLDEYISIDESMIPYYGKHFAKQFIRGKPIRFGFKNWALCTNNGYMISFDIYTGKKTNTPNESHLFGLGGTVVLNLLRSAEIPPNSGYKIFTDNYFTSIKLLNHLCSLGYCATGTIRDNRLEDCPLRNLQKNLTKEKRGAHVFSRSEKVIVFQWKDNKVVTAASNFESSEIKDTTRYCRERKSKITVPQPKIFQNYNKGMGGVDKLDGLVAVYRTRMRQRKWWWPIFSYLFDVSVVNAWLSFRKIHPSHEMSSGLLKFRRYLALSLLKSQGKKSTKGKITPAPLYDVRFDQINHLPEYTEEERRCAQCGKNAKFICIKCQRALHPKNCFLQYHTP